MQWRLLGRDVGRFGKWLKAAAWSVAGVTAVVALAAFMVDSWMSSYAARFVGPNAYPTPRVDVAVVLGTAPKVWQGRPNQFFERRMDAAAELWKKGEVRWLLVSGDNRKSGYDEPSAMRTALITRGVPDAAIYHDYAGIRTLDSIVRAREVFGQQRMIVVSQRFHNERAVFLARQHGIEAWGCDAAEVEGALGLVPRLREYVARLRAVYDIARGSQPLHAGPPVRIGHDPPG